MTTTFSSWRGLPRFQGSFPRVFARLGASLFVLFSLALSLRIPRSVSASDAQSKYLQQPGTPVAIQNFVHPEAGCNWSGVGGQVFDLERNPVTGLIVMVGGTLEGNQVLYYALSGSSTKFGSGGFDIRLADHPVASQGTLKIQLLDNAGKPISALIPLNTYDSCERNLILINLVEFPTDLIYYFPLIFR